MRHDLADVMADLRREVVDVGWPVPSQVKGRIPLITRFRSEGHIARIVRARLQGRVMSMLLEDGDIDYSALFAEYVELYLQYLVSIRGKGRTELVQIAKWVQEPPQRRGILGWLRR